MGDTDKLVAYFGGQMVVGSVIVLNEEGRNIEAARCIEGVWVVTPEYLAKIADYEAAQASVSKGKKAVSSDA
jgi:hypothetical protein